MVAKSGFGDTSEVAARRYVELLRMRSPAQRAAILSGLNATVRKLAEVSVRRMRPAATEREVAAHVAARLYGIEIASRFFPDVSLA